MTENKRFTVETFIDDYLCGFKDLEGNECEIRYDGKPMTYREVTDLLNELAEEKEYYQIKSGKCEEELLKLRRDNEQLKHDATVLICSNQDYRKENEQLKQVIKEVLKLLEEEVDLFSDKATEHDIQAYIELGELDNKDAYYMAISTKKVIKLLKEVIE